MAVDWATEHKLDGLRVDAAKHMSHAVLFNLRSRTQEALSPPGSNFLFPLIGETFDDAPLINAYIGPDQLHGQFDFPLYWTLRNAFIYDTASVGDAVRQAASMESNYPGGLMSTFLGNLDVGRFLTEAHEYSSNVCPDGDIRQAGAPEDGLAFDRLRLAWTLLFTQPGMPMVYYGDELGLPGYGDPDNRQPLSWHGVDLTEHDAMSLAETLPSGPARVLDTVTKLTAARSSHPALRGGSQVQWWEGGPGLYATAHVRDGDQAIVILNRTDTEQWLDNGLRFAGLTGEQWTDVLSGEQFMAGEDRLIVSVPPYTPRVLVLTE
jgi:glycosidase